MDEVTGEAPEVTTPDQPAVAEATAPAPEPTVESFTDIDPESATRGPGGHSGVAPGAVQADAGRLHPQAAGRCGGRQGARTEELEFLESLRSDPDTQRAVFEQLQELLDQAGDEDDDEYGDDDAKPGDEADPLSPLEQRLAQLEAEREAEKAEALAGQIVEHIQTLATEHELDLDEDDLRAVFDQATAEGVSKQGTEAAVKAFADRQKAREAKWQEKYLATKQAPTQLPAGTAGTDAPDLSNADVRQRRMAALLGGGS
jgi:hypothetical protein